MKKKQVKLSRLALKKEEIGRLTASVTGGVFIGTILPPKGTAYTCVPEVCVTLESCPDTADCITNFNGCPPPYTSRCTAV